MLRRSLFWMLSMHTTVNRKQNVDGLFRMLGSDRTLKTLPPRVDDEQRVTRLEHGNAKVDHTQMDHTAADLRGEGGMSAAA